MQSWDPWSGEQRLRPKNSGNMNRIVFRFNLFSENFLPC
jgi:hypothetical protein